MFGITIHPTGGHIIHRGRVFLRNRDGRLERRGPPWTMEDFGSGRMPTYWGKKGKVT